MIINTPFSNRAFSLVALIFPPLMGLVFLILIAPNIFKTNYLFVMYLAFIVASIVAIVTRKRDFLIVLFIISLSFTAFNINVKQYFPLIGNAIPWIMAGDLLLFILVIIELVKLCISKSRLLFPVKANFAFLLLIGYFVISYVLVSPKYSSYQSAGFFSLMEVIKGYVVFIYFYNYLTNLNRYRVVIISFAFVIMMQFCFMLYQWLTGDCLVLVNFFYESLDNPLIEQYGITRKAFGTFAYPSIAGNIMILIHPMAIAFTSFQKSTNKTITFCKYLIMTLAPLCVLLSGARMALVAMFFVIPSTLLVMANSQRHRQIYRYSTALILFIILLTFIASTIPTRSAVIEYWKERFSFEDFCENSLMFRLLIYKIGIRALKENPMFGVGWGNGDKYSFNLITASEVHLYNFGLHNGYIAIIVETGIIGLLIYSFWYISLLRCSLSRDNHYDRSYQIPFLGGIFIVVIISMIFIDTQAALIGSQTEYLHFCLCLAFLRAQNEIVRKKPE